MPSPAPSQSPSLQRVPIQGRGAQRLSSSAGEEMTRGEEEGGQGGREERGVARPAKGYVPSGPYMSGLEETSNICRPAVTSLSSARQDEGIPTGAGGSYLAADGE